jgi:peptidyl-tRNA hydrolase
VETTNAYDPNQDSVAQRTHEAITGRKASKNILYDCIEATDFDNLQDTTLLRNRLQEAYGDSYWVDIDTIIAAIEDPRTPPGDAYRFYLNIIKPGDDRWMPKSVWESCADTDDPIMPKDQITIGFDGSLYSDATCLMGCRLRDGKLFILGLWESDGSDEWEVPIGEVDAVLYKAFKDYRVAWAYCDPYYWQDVIDRWAAEFGDKIIFKFPTNRERPMCEAIERFHTSAVTGQLKHDGDPDLQRHVLNAVTKEARQGYVITKDRPKSKNKIDAAVAAILAYEACYDAIRGGRMRKRRRAIGL